ncbi:MAG: ER lumen protein-retaining receptor [archaeon]|nr:ER lumen protein-retaining receptor [archaeon]
MGQEIIGQEEIFMRFGDGFHLLATLLILFKIFKDRNYKGLSLRTQEIYLILFCFRYFDLYWYKVSNYNTIMKITFVVTTLFAVILMYLFKSPEPCNKESILYFGLIPIAVLFALAFHSAWTKWEMTWTVTFWSECLAMIPTVAMAERKEYIKDYIPKIYIFLLFCYKFFYMLFWNVRYTSNQYICMAILLSSMLQMGILGNSFYNLMKKFFLCPKEKTD